jgi:heme O synthase-like polyprenyltransferase
VFGCCWLSMCVLFVVVACFFVSLCFFFFFFRQKPEKKLGIVAGSQAGCPSVLGGAAIG